MKAYKVWHDEKHFVHQDSTPISVVWTTDSSKAKNCISWKEAYDFFFDYLGFNLNVSRPGSLQLLDNRK